MNPIIR